MRPRAFVCASILALAASALVAQEPQPSRLRGSFFTSPEGVSLTLPWRFAPGDGVGREAPDFDDNGWRALEPQMPPASMPWSQWSGIGWFRRHILIDPSLNGRPLALRLDAPGLADVYVDGRLVLSSMKSATVAEVPSDHRDATVIRLAGNRHLVAVRYVYPTNAQRVDGPIGFHLTLATPGMPAAPAPPVIAALQGGVPHIGSWIVAVQGAIIALPLFLAFIHLALFGFDVRARENLFYAVEMLAFALILLHDLGAAFLPTDAQRALVDRIEQGGPPIAILFGLLTYYAVRIRPYPRSWRVMVAAGLITFAASYAVPEYTNPIWTVYFFIMLLEIIRLEVGGRTVKREEARVFLLSFAIFCFTIVLQALINFELLEPVGGVREVYLFGILSSAVGMSIYLARRMGRSRAIAAENERKTAELTQARELQLSMLPQQLPRVGGLDVAASTHTAAEVGGDYYDVRPAGDGALLFAFGDATGHGLASGIVVTAAKALFNAFPADASPRELLADCDHAFRAMQLPALRMCLSLARVSASEATVASAAMPPLLVHRAASDTVDELGAGALPLGSRLPSRYEDRRLTLGEGDTLLFASDGFAELLDADDREFGYPRVSAAFRDAARAGTAREVIERLGAIAAEYRGGRPLSDDITFVAIRIMRSTNAQH